MIRTVGPIPLLDYYDSQSVTLARPVAPLQAWNTIMASPQPLLRAAFKVRDAISSRFGVKRIGGFTGQPVSEVVAGQYLDFFLVEEASPTRLVLTERDRHLDVMTCISSAGSVITITSSVITHNRFGRAYMVPVGIAHRVIVRNMLNRLMRAVPEL
jgi:hypothetical protein